jgi:hypothetical protein
MPMNMDRVCRICLQENTNLSPIFCNGQGVGNLSDLPQKIQICGAVECHEQDGLPALICDVCIYKASVAHEFRQLCQHSDTRLRLYYNKPAKYNAIVRYIIIFILIMHWLAIIEELILIFSYFISNKLKLKIHTWCHYCRYIYILNILK